VGSGFEPALQSPQQSGKILLPECGGIEPKARKLFGAEDAAGIGATELISVVHEPVPTHLM
jgi:hypothetical protein